MSPPLVVAFALAGRVDLDLAKDPIGKDKERQGRFPASDLWPTLGEIRDAMQSALTPEVFRRLYRDFADQNPKWNEIPSSTGDVYQWDEKSDYIHEPPFFADFSMAAGHDRRYSRRAAARHFRRLGHDRSHFAGRRDQSELAGRANIWSRAGSSRRTSTATAAGAATIWS